MTRSKFRPGGAGTSSTKARKAPIPRSTPEVITADRRAVPMQIVRDAPPWVRLACETLEAAGFRIAGNGEELGRYVLIDCLLPSALRDVMSADNPAYETIMRHQVALARQALRKAGFDVEPRPNGWRLTIWLPMSKKPRIGRPTGTRPEEDAAIAARDLSVAGDTFPQIAEKLRPAFGSRNPGAWQKLVRRYFPGCK